MATQDNILFNRLTQAKVLLVIINCLWLMAQLFSSVEAAEKSKDEGSQSVWLLTDIHYMSPKLTDKGQRYQIFQKQAAGIDYDYGPDRLEALIEQVEREHPAAIIVAGDLTSNGEYQSMVDLAVYFGRIEALGSQVFVIPGNHDIHNGWAVRFEGEKTVKERQTSPADFAEIFADFGYDEALSRDSASLSYLAQVSDNWQLLMIDTNIYSDQPGRGPSESKGQVKAETLEWAANLLSETPAETLILPVMHHGALSHFRGEIQTTTMADATNIQKLLAKQEIPLTLAGHLHSQQIATLMVDQQPLHEVITTSFSIYPGKIGEVTLSEQTLTYQQIDLEMESWLGTEQYSTYLAHLKQLQTDSTHVIIFDTLYNDAELKAHTEEISAVFQQLNLSFFMGSMAEDWAMIEPELQAVLPLIEPTDYRFFNGYLDLLLSTKEYSQTHLTVEW